MVACRLFVLIVCAALGAQAGRTSAFQAETGDSVVVERDLKIPMRDGLCLAADVYRPARAGKPVEERMPILLQRTPYDKTGRRLVEQAKLFAARGYVVVLQDVRGRYGSEGVFTKYIGEGQDGCDTIEWLARLQYTNGWVGMWGTSYAAHVQASAAKLRPPHLATIIVNMGGIYDGWDHKIRNHGAFELQQLTWAFSQLAAETRDPVVREMLRLEKAADWLKALPFRKGLNPLSIAPNFEDYILEMMTRADYDDYWKQLDINWREWYPQTADIPMLHVSGWYDSYCGGTVQNFLGLSRLKKSPIRLLMGPWTHGANTRSFAGEVEFGAEASHGDFNEEFHLRWFDHFLKGVPNGVEKEASVRIFVMGTGDGSRDKNGRLVHGGYWKNAAGWPLPGTRFTKYYLGAGGLLTADAPAEEIPPTTYTHDPANPVPTLGGAFSSTSPIFESGAYDQREREGVYGCNPPYLPLKARKDVVVFQTAPLEQNVEIVGPITMRLYASSTAVDTDFTVKLVDVYPPSAEFPTGFEMNLTDGILRARYRNSRDKQELMKPGEVYEFVIEPFPTANVFKKGHRIRVDIASSNFPRFDVNPGTGEPLGANRRAIRADNTIYHDALRPSHIVLPIQ